MPTSPTYPGVYLEEIPSGVRTITGVATAITAFIGRALRGPTDEDGPVTINSYADFERVFGGLWVESTLGYAVRDFYLNGGGQAVIVRLYKPTNFDKAELTRDPLTLEAAYPGVWGNFLRVRVDYDVSGDVAKQYNLDKDNLFNLTVRDTKTLITEQFRNLTVADSPRKLDKVLENESKLLRVKGSLPPSTSRPAAHDAPTAGEDIWGANSLCSTGVTIVASDGELLTNEEFTGSGREASKKGLYALDKVDLFNLLCIPPYLLNGDIEYSQLLSTAVSYCEKRRAMLLIDPPSEWKDKAVAKGGIASITPKSKNAAIFFPRLRQPNPLRDNQREDFVPSGAVAGIFARTDAQRGVWKAPAGLDASLYNVPELSVSLTDAENGELNPLGINCLRIMPAVGGVVWGARTLQGDDRLASEWKYIPVRRTALFIEESLYRGLQWVVFEPNDEPLWAQIRLNVGAFMNNLFRQGAFQGRTTREAYLVKCDRETTTQNDINLGIVNIVVGFAPLKPAEFVIIKIQQLAGQIAV
jgi:phage tail sheath protein FI